MYNVHSMLELLTVNGGCRRVECSVARLSILEQYGSAKYLPSHLEFADERAGAAGRDAASVLTFLLTSSGYG